MLPGLFKAEYLFRPGQLLRGRRRDIQSDDFVTARLPWGKSIRVSTRDNIGPQLIRIGVYDLIVTETVWRLCDLGDVAVDVGANVGCMTAAMAHRVGAVGEVHSFEPHPQLFHELVSNIASLKQQGEPGAFHPRPQALGAVAGRLPLKIPRDFAAHRGESSLVDRNDASEAAIEVDVKRRTRYSLRQRRSE